MVVVVVLAAVAILLFSDITLRLFSVKGKDNALSIAFCFLFICIQKEVHAEKDEAEGIAFLEYKKDKKQKKVTGLKSIYRLYKKFKRLPLVEQDRLSRALRFVLRRARIVLERLIVKIGFGDAFATSIAASSAMIALNGIFAKTGRFKAAKSGETKVLPVFDKERFEVDVHCIIHIKPVHIIIGYFKFLLKRRY